MNAHIESKDKDRVQDDIGNGTQKHRHHSDGPKALGIDKAVHTQPHHHEQVSQQIDGDIVLRVGDGGVAGPEEVEHGALKGQAQHCQHNSRSHHHYKRISHDFFCFFQVSPSPLNGTQGRPAHSEQIGKSGDNGNDGKAKPQPRQGQGGVLRNQTDIEPVHNIVHHINQLGQGHGQSQL